MNNRVVKNASWIIGCKIAQSILNLIIGMISARYLGPSNFGLISYAGSLVNFVLPIMQLGLGKTLVQEIIENPDKEGRVLGTAMVMNVVSGMICMGGVFIFLNFANAGETETIIVGVLYSISLIFQATEMIHNWFQAKLLSKYPSIASLISYTVVALYKIWLLVTGKSVRWFAVSFTIDVLLISVILILIYKKMGDQPFSFSWELGRKMLNRSKYYIISSMMVTIYAQTDRIMLKLMMNEAETGYYNAAVVCVNVTSFVFVAILDSMRPVILEAKHKRDPSYEPLIVQLYSVITYVSLAQCVVMTVFARPLVTLLYGEAYLASVVPLMVAVWYITFSNYGSVRNIWILAEGKQKYLLIINLSGALANVAANLILIPRLGAEGAAAASLITQFFANVVLGFIMRPIRHNNTLMIKGLDPRPLARFIKNTFNKVLKRGGR